MPTTIIALKIILILIPGFFTLLIQESLGERKERTQLEKILTILLYDIFIFGIYLSILKIFPALNSFILNISGEKIDVIGVSFLNIVIILTLSAILGLIFALFNIYSWHYKLLRKWKLTYKSGRISVWNDIFYDLTKSYVIVHLDDETRIFGWISDFSADPGKKYLFIRDAKYLGSKPKKDVEIKGEGILLTPEAKIKYIEFLTPK